MTKKQKIEYLKNPHYCPKCKGSDISAMNWDAEAQMQYISCKCGAVWKEYFTMVSVEME